MNPLSPFCPPFRKKARGKVKKRSSEGSDSDALEVIKEWNTSSRGGNPEGRNRAEPVEEGKCVTVCVITTIYITDPVPNPAGLVVFGPKQQRTVRFSVNRRKPRLRFCLKTVCALSCPG